jgi:hypothetical protein
MSSVSNDLQALFDVLDDLVEQPVARPDPLAPITIPEADVEKALAGLDYLDDKANDQPKVEVPAVEEPVAADDIKAENDEIEAAVALELEVQEASELTPIDEDEFATLPVPKASTEPASTDDFEAVPHFRILNPRAGRDILARIAGVTDGIVAGGIMVAGRRYEWARNLAGQSDKSTAEGALGINRRTFSRQIKSGASFADALAKSQEAGRRYARTVEYAGQEMHLSDFADLVGLSLRTVQLYTKQGMTGEEIASRDKKKPGPKGKCGSVQCDKTEPH